MSCCLENYFTKILWLHLQNSCLLFEKEVFWLGRTGSFMKLGINLQGPMLIDKVKLEQDSWCKKENPFLLLHAKNNETLRGCGYLRICISKSGLHQLNQYTIVKPKGYYCHIMQLAYTVRHDWNYVLDLIYG